MNEDDTQAAWHQLELERWQELLESDPAWERWLKDLNEPTENRNEIPRETIGRL